MIFSKSMPVLLLGMLTVSAYSQTEPKIGLAMPDFELKNIINYPLKSASLADFKGKWLFLDFWFTGCTACIQSFPKISALHERFSDKANFVLVGMNDIKRNKDIQKLYEKFRQKQNLKMPAAFDSLLVTNWNIVSMPHIFIIDPDGILHDITDGRDFNFQNIEKLVNGQKMKMYSKHAYRTDFNPYNLSELQPKIKYQSLLTEWNNEKQVTRLNIEDEIKYLKNSEPMAFSMVPLKWLYNWAYIGTSQFDSPTDSLYGKFYPDPILEIKDSLNFRYDFDVDVGKGTYNYSLTLPPSKVSVKNVMLIMQNDLKNIFGYNAQIEERELPVWKLVVKDARIASRLISKGGVLFIETGVDVSGGAGGFTARNMAMDRFLNDIMYYVGMGQPPYFNETDIQGNIDIKFKALLTDWKDVIRELNKHGLDLIKGTKKMRCIVIRDPNK